MWLAWGKVGKESSWKYLEVSAQVNAKVRGAEEGKPLFKRGNYLGWDWLGHQTYFLPEQTARVFQLPLQVSAAE